MKCYTLLATLLCLAAATLAHQTPEETPLASGIRMVRKLYNQCEKSEQIIKCLKQQALRITERAVRMQAIPVLDGMTIVKRKDVSEEGRSLGKYAHVSEERLRSLSSEELDEALAEQTARFMDTHQMSLTVSSLLGDEKSEGSIGRMIEEGRGKMKKYMGPILTAIAIKGGFVAMAFQTIAMIAGKALLIGKIALVLSAIIGLKKLVSSGEAHEKTTYEIVKHPQVSQSHTYSSSHYGGGDYEASGTGGHYRRSYESAQERAYSAHVPRS